MRPGPVPLVVCVIVQGETSTCPGSSSSRSRPPLDDRGDEGTVRPEILAQEGVRDEETAIVRVGREFLCFRACCGGPFADLDVDVLGVGKKLAADATRLRQCRENVARQGQEAAAGRKVACACRSGSGSRPASARMSSRDRVGSPQTGRASVPVGAVPPRSSLSARGLAASQPRSR